MAIWVSRYANKKLREEGYYPVGISLGKPKYPLGYELREQCYSLAPKGYMLHLDDASYKEAYIGKLEAIGVDKIVEIVTKLDQKARDEGKELVLLCYEDIRNEDEWCHRTLFAEWWAEKKGEKITELDDPTPPKSKRKATKEKETSNAEEVRDKFAQLDLFSIGVL